MKQNAVVQDQKIELQQDQIKKLSRVVCEQGSDQKPNKLIQQAVDNLEKERSKVNFYKKKCEEVDKELALYSDGVNMVESLRVQVVSLKINQDSLNEKLIQKDDIIKNSSSRYYQAMKKIDQLCSEKRELEAKNLDSETERKKVLEKWQK